MSRVAKDGKHSCILLKCLYIVLGYIFIVKCEIDNHSTKYTQRGLQK